MNHHNLDLQVPTPWNKGKLVGQKPPLKLKEIWESRLMMPLKWRNRLKFSRSVPGNVDPGVFWFLNSSRS